MMIDEGIQGMVSMTEAVGTLSSESFDTSVTSHAPVLSDRMSQPKQATSGKILRQQPIPAGSYHNIPYVYRGMMPPPNHFPSQPMPYPYMMNTNSSGHMQFPPMCDPRNARFLPTNGTKHPMPSHPGYFIRNSFPNGANPVGRYPLSYQTVSNGAVNPSTFPSNSDGHTRKRSADGEQTECPPSNSVMTIHRSDSLGSTGSTTTSSVVMFGENYTREMHDNIGGIAMMVSNDSRSFEGHGDKRSLSPSSTTTLSLGCLSMESTEQSCQLGPSSRDFNVNEILENLSKRQKSDSSFDNQESDRKDAPVIISKDQGKTPISKNTIFLKDNELSLEQTSGQISLLAASTNVPEIEKMKTPAIVKIDFLPSSGSDTGFSPTIDHSLSDLVPQLSWASSLGNSPPIDDIVNWADSENKRNVTMDESPLSLDGTLCPMEWKVVKSEPCNGDSSKMALPQDDPLNLPLWSPKSLGGNSPESITPLPFFFGHNGFREKEMKDERETENVLMHYDDGSKILFNKANPPTPYTIAQARPQLIESRDDSGSTREDNRVRNLRGNVKMMSPFQLYSMTPSRFPSRNSELISPMTQVVSANFGPLWRSPHIPMQPQPSNPLLNSKRKCVQLKPPLPLKFQGDMEAMKSAPVPDFSNLVNFPSHISQKQTSSLPSGMRCCVMCGYACPCSLQSKSKKVTMTDKNGLPSHASDRDGASHPYVPGYGTIPTQNKGLCTRCDVNVWVVVASGLEIKWCKGCKNFRPWAAFGEKGLATKCVRCRERQREKYALQKEEKDVKGGSLDEDDA